MWSSQRSARVSHLRLHAPERLVRVHRLRALARALWGVRVEIVRRRVYVSQAPRHHLLDARGLENAGPLRFAKRELYIGKWGRREGGKKGGREVSYQSAPRSLPAEIDAVGIRYEQGKTAGESISTPGFLSFLGASDEKHRGHANECRDGGVRCLSVWSRPATRGGKGARVAECARSSAQYTATTTTSVHLPGIRIASSCIPASTCCRCRSFPRRHPRKQEATSKHV